MSEPRPGAVTCRALVSSSPVRCIVRCPDGRSGALFPSYQPWEICTRVCLHTYVCIDHSFGLPSCLWLFLFFFSVLGLSKLRNLLFSPFPSRGPPCSASLSPPPPQTDVVCLRWERRKGYEKKQQWFHYSAVSLTKQQDTQASLRHSVTLCATHIHLDSVFPKRHCLAACRHLPQSIFGSPDDPSLFLQPYESWS